MKELELYKMGYMELKDLSKESLVELVEEIRNSLSNTEDAEDFCMYVADTLSVDLRVSGK